ncbi:Hypothetical_protein [Hexamita inflata]|uniref:Hypothetical_protein n=1 Tax=Hexamita inflata TaxID=28002 RepID=A0AA86RGJ8_9EUKA|nr:Hypothetical protein HINF_LOCUS13772 [Hexamita inflata]CAI9969456.1 Hypothetical protein HINF_LOCUS57101 [Hexamita inflata]CAI9976117.1 Hypothetical protein HINF_LOCUS63762 [Hexamita inflata]
MSQINQNANSSLQQSEYLIQYNDAYFDDQYQEKSTKIIQQGLEIIQQKDFRIPLKMMIKNQQDYSNPLQFFFSALILLLAFLIFVVFVYTWKDSQIKYQ